MGHFSGSIMRPAHTIITCSYFMDQFSDRWFTCTGAGYRTGGKRYYEASTTQTRRKYFWTRPGLTYFMGKCSYWHINYRYTMVRYQNGQYSLANYCFYRALF